MRHKETKFQGQTAQHKLSSNNEFKYISNNNK